MLKSFDVQFAVIELFKMWLAKSNHGWMSIEDFFNLFDKFRNEYFERYHFGNK